jgi:hypothetical protein
LSEIRFVVVDHGGRSSVKDLEHILSERELPHEVLPASDSYGRHEPAGLAILSNFIAACLEATALSHAHRRRPGNIPASRLIGIPKRPDQF